MTVSMTVTAKGQITLKKDVLRHLGIKPGDKVDVELLPSQGVSIRAKHREGKIEDLFGMLAYDGPAKSLEEIEQAIGDGWAGIR